MKRPFIFTMRPNMACAPWFKEFDVEKCYVSPNFTVPFMLGFLLSEVPESVGVSCGKKARKAVAQTTLRDWEDLWSDPSKVPAVFQQLQNLPNEFQSRISARFELVAPKPQAPGCESD